MGKSAKLVLVIGGSRSGKSRFAEAYCANLQKQAGLPVTYIATCPRIDAELEARIAAHVARRPAEWGCIEEATRVAQRIRELDGSAGILLLDCLSLLLNNWRWEAEQRGKAGGCLGEAVQRSADGETDRPGDGEAVCLSDEQVAELTEELLQACKQYPHPVVIVTSEVGAGIVPESKSLRAYRDQLGLMNQLAAREADAVYAVMAGIPVNLKELQVRL
ncbi:bifunctional adenosylcobinamide kinase/adenosylcobinamide-phosphate guanylyltransferase [Effusibacillus pohliae]|uniref:bifunctional adenosylcobinamide kinase/adenosylcobinamide-phosphate guanylyltransferase n=1 Tax=Effusibacillus pohliae TaxID=232270 RepID=UPI00038096A7|nr:bifunctional adenosylcobinamide kinase/adenosylcobinamide-phosphate guanylyltransferase [Effusibacillus pohliae]